MQKKKKKKKNASGIYLRVKNNVVLQYVVEERIGPYGVNPRAV